MGRARPPNCNTWVEGQWQRVQPVVSDLDAGSLGGLAASDIWRLGGNTGTDPNTQFLGTTDNTRLRLHAASGIEIDNTTPHLSFGRKYRQAINLWHTNYAIGAQSRGGLYFRSEREGFSWYADGSHRLARDDEDGPGDWGQTLAKLDYYDGLYVNGAFVARSDRSAKQDFEPVDSRDMLERVAALPVMRWRYTNNPANVHLGPVAQDFRAAFGLGQDDQTIATVDADGVALAAIQGLKEKVESRSQESGARIQKLENDNAALKQELAELRKLVQRHNAQLNGVRR